MNAGIKRGSGQVTQPVITIEQRRKFEHHDRQPELQRYSIINGTPSDAPLFIYKGHFIPNFNPATDYGRVLMYGNGCNDRVVGSHGNDVLTGNYLLTADDFIL